MSLTSEGIEEGLAATRGVKKTGSLAAGAKEERVANMAAEPMNESMLAFVEQ